MVPWPLMVLLFGEFDPGFSIERLASVIGFYAWLFTDVIDTFDEVHDKLGTIAPIFGEIFRFLLIGTFIAMWFAILFLPLYSHWQRRKRCLLLYCLQGAYSAIQAGFGWYWWLDHN